MENNLKNIELFKPESILQNNVTEKKIAILGKLQDREGEALIVLTRQCFPDDIEQLSEMVFNKETKVEYEEDSHNDKQSLYNLIPSAQEFNRIHAKAIFPADFLDTAVFQEPNYWFVEETPELYSRVTLPFIKNSILPKKKEKWVHNILNGKNEEKRVIYNSKYFVLVKDSKWQSEETLEMRLVALPRTNLMTIRDLNGNHLSLLKRIKKKCEKFIEREYEVPANKLRVYFRYFPSTYYLHVFFTHFAAVRAEELVDRAHLLSTVINNIDKNENYYQEATIGIRLCNEEAYNRYKP